MRFPSGHPLIALKDHQLREVDSLRDFFRSTSRTAHSEEAFRQITARTFGTAMPYLPVSVARLEPDRRRPGLRKALRKSKEIGPGR